LLTAQKYFLFNGKKASVFGSFIVVYYAVLFNVRVIKDFFRWVLFAGFQNCNKLVGLVGIIFKYKEVRKIESLKIIKMKIIISRNR